MSKIENAIVKSTMLGTEDHGIFTAYLFVEGGHWSGSFGGYAFDEWNADKQKRVGHSFGIEFISQTLETLEVDKWEKLPGTHLRVETEGWGGKISRIGHIYKEKWFDPRKLAEEMYELKVRNA